MTHGLNDPQAVTTEDIQDAIGSAFVATATIQPSYSDALNQFTWDVINASVTNAKLMTMATMTLKGNNTGSTGPPVDLTAAQVKMLLAYVVGDLGAVGAHTVLMNPTGSSAAPVAGTNVQLTAEVQPAVLGVTPLSGAMSIADKRRMGQVYDAVADFGFVGDLMQVVDGACSTGANTKITSATAAFSTARSDGSTDVGRRITLAGAGAAGAMYVGTITAVDSGTQVTVSPTISTTVASKTLQWGTDNTTAIGNMTTVVNSTTRPGVRIVFGESLTNAYGFPIPVVFTQTVQIEGVGGGHTADQGDYTRIGGTRLAWWASSSDGGTAFGGFFTVSPTGVQSLKHPAFRRCWLDCRNGDQNQALYGLKLASCHGWRLDDFFIMDPLAIGLWFDIATSPTEAKDCTRGLATEICFRCLDATSSPVTPSTTPTTTSSAVSLVASTSLTLAAGTVGLVSAGAGYAWVMTAMGKPTLVRFTGGGLTTTLTGVICATEDAANVPTTVSGANIVTANPANACAMYLNGGIGANTSCNTLIQTQISHTGNWGPAAIEFGNSDSNEFMSCYINGGTRALISAINRMTKPGVRFNGSDTNVALAARNNHFTGGDPGSLPTTNGGVEAIALRSSGTALLSFPSGPNYWDQYEQGNGAPAPTVEALASSATQGRAGASFDWQPNGGLRIGVRSIASTADQALAAASTAHVLGSLVVLPPQAIQIGTTFRWTIALSKTAAGTAARLTNIRVGTAGTSADPNVMQFSVTPTAVLDNGVMSVVYTITAVGAAATGRGMQSIVHSAAAAGLANNLTAAVAGASTTFNSVTSGLLFISLSCTTGAAEVLTFQQCFAEVVIPGAP